jgi:hypothetical protein
VLLAVPVAGGSRDLGVRVRRGTERERRGDHEEVVTDFGGGRSSGAPRAAAAGSTTSRGGTLGRPTTRSERRLAQKARLVTLGVEARELGTRCAGSSSVCGDLLQQCRQRTTTKL